ncbi:hypothetical protein F3J09_28365 [Bacillus sp. Ab-1751]|nr:hypothetical protein [Bacillus sp. Ab-1751]NRQ71404.1 hypothetical protein [Bacillus cereus]
MVNKESIEKFKKKFEGKTIKDKGFTSTSLAICNKYLGEKTKTVRMAIEVLKEHMLDTWEKNMRN